MSRGPSQGTDDNDRLDKNFLGISTKPYVFSNNMRSHLAAASFQECKFLGSGPRRVVSIALKVK